MNSKETQQMLDSAIANNVSCMVTYQRRYTAVTQEAMRLVKERGQATLAMGEFHKPGNPDGDEMASLWNDVCHVADLVRYMIGSEVMEVTAYQDAQENGAKNVFNGLIRFANHAIGIVSGNRCSGGRVLRSELHGRGVGCYMMHIPRQIEICENGKAPRIVMGWELLALTKMMRLLTKASLLCTNILWIVSGRDKLHAVTLGMLFILHIWLIS